MKKEINSKIESLLKSDQFESIIGEVKELRRQYNEIEQKEEEEAKKKFVEDGGEEASFSVTRDEDDKKFMELMTEFNGQKKNYDDQLLKQEEENYKKKQDLLKELETLIKDETNISASFRGLNDIRARWEKVGKVPKDKFKELQHDFSLQLEYFYYNINIYKTLKEYDLEKNLKIKQELIGKMKALLEEKSIKDVRIKVEELMAEWDNVGPTFQDKWQQVRDDFWGTAAQVHKKIKDHYINLKDQYKKNYEAKLELCNKVEEISKRELGSEKAWKKATDEVLNIQKEWKSIGFATKKHNQEVWTKFRSILDEFFDKKKEFYGKQKEVYNKFEKQKTALIEEAEALKDSTDWKEATAAFINLQKKWKQIGHAGKQKEYKLWNRFNGAANHFFEAKKHYYDTLDDRMANNLKSKEAVIDEVKAFKPTGDKKKDLDSLKQFNVSWNNVGIIAKKDIGKVNSEFNKALDEQYEKIGVKGQEKESTKFKSRVEGLKNADNADDLLYNESKKIKEQIKKLESEVVQYENNLGFFSSAKTDNPLVMAAKQKVEDSKKELEKLKARLKIVYS